MIQPLMVHNTNGATYINSDPTFIGARSQMIQSLLVHVPINLHVIPPSSAQDKQQYIR